MINKPLISMSRDELKKHIFNLQKFMSPHFEKKSDILAAAAAAAGVNAVL